MITLIFDFDGTLADTLERSLRVANSIALDFGIPIVSPETFDLLRDLTVAEIRQQLRIPAWKVPFFLRRLRREMLAILPELNCVAEMPETLKQLRSSGVRLGIVTSNDYRNVTLFLEQHQLRSVFDFVDGGARILGKGRRLRSIVQRYQLKPSEVFYVGDEMRDIRAARQVGMQSIAVTWGFNTPTALQSFQPDFLIDHPSQLWEICRQFVSPDVNYD